MNEFMALLCLTCFSYGRRVALKIIRNIPKYYEAAKTEIEILAKLQKVESKGKQ